jgi:GNAT superfamily N-acetyltransferase
MSSAGKRLSRIVIKVLSCIMIITRRTNSSDPEFQSLVALLDAELAIVDGDDASFYAQLNKTDNMKHTLVAYIDNLPVGCGAIRAFADDSMEIKRMFVLTTHRRSGVASSIVGELEKWSKELGHKYCVLETGKRQPEAIALYLRMGFETIPNYGKYVGMDNSVCFRKVL